MTVISMHFLIFSEFSKQYLDGLKLIINYFQPVRGEYSFLSKYFVLRTIFVIYTDTSCSKLR